MSQPFNIVTYKMEFTKHIIQDDDLYVFEKNNNKNL